MNKITGKVLVLYVIVIFPVKILLAAFESYPISTFNTGFGKMTLSTKGNILDIFNEPSSLIQFKKEGGEVIWNRPFQINELQQTAFAAGLIYKGWGIGIGASNFGNKIYSESIFTITAANSFKGKLNYGVNILVYQLKIDNYGTDHTIGITGSIRYNINKSWDWVSTVRNINLPKIGSTKEALPRIVTTGFVGSIYEKITIAAEWEQDIDFEGSLKFGVMLKPIDQLYISVGGLSNPGQFTAGISLNINKLYFEYGTIAYNDIGLFTHQLGIGVNINRH